MFVKMPNRNSIINEQQPTTLRRSPRLQHRNKPHEPQDSKNPKPKSRNKRVNPSPISISGTPYLDSPLSSTPNASLKTAHKYYPEKDTKKSSKSNGGSKNCSKLGTGSRRSPRLNNGVEGFSCRRRSPRLCNCGNTDEKTGNDKSVEVRNAKGSVDSCEQFVGKRERRLRSKSVGSATVIAERGEGQARDVNKGDKDIVVKRKRKQGEEGVGHVQGNDKSVEVRNAKGSVDSCEQFVGKRERRLRSNSVGSATVIAERGERQARDVNKGDKDIVVKRKRKRGEEGVGHVQGWTKEQKRGEEGDGHVRGWTKEQEVALQRAYIAAKPTPQFWKKVAKLVPGKTAQDCFDKVHSDNLTPPQPRPRSRAKGTNLSSMGYFSLSASKLLKPTEPKIKRPSCNKQKSHLAQKTVRHLLQKHSNVDKLYEADLFSVLEPTINPSTQAFQQSVILSTPEHAPEKQGLLQKFRERSSSGHKKSLSRLISSCGTALVSPPVLKPVKNRALHEKYIDQLHCREAKRKAASAKASKSVPEHEDREERHVQKFDVLRSVKNALVSDARDVISHFQHLQANPMSNSSDFDDNDVVNDDDDDEEGEDGL